MTSAGQAAAGGPQEIEQIPEEEEEAELGTDMLSHTFHLRADTRITFELPTDLSKQEAERLAAFIRILPIENENDGRMA